MGGEPGLRPSGLTQESSQTTLPEATHLYHYCWPLKPSPINLARERYLSHPCYSPPLFASYGVGKVAQ